MYRWPTIRAQETYYRRGSIGGAHRARATYSNQSELGHRAEHKFLDTGFTAMQRTVGFTMSCGAQLIATGKMRKCGVLTPLDLAYDDVLLALEHHGIKVKITRE